MMRAISLPAAKPANVLAVWWQRLLLTAVVICCLATASMAQAAEFPAVFEAEQSAILSAERAGVVKTLAVKEGDSVKRGALLFRLDRTELELSLQQKRHNQSFLKQRVATLSSLVRDGIAPEDELAEAVLQRDVNESEMQLLQHYINHSELKAPFAGKVTARSVQQFEWVTQGQPIIALVNPSKLRLATNLPADIAVALKPGATHRVRVPAVNGEVSVKLQVVISQVEVQSNTVRVLWEVVKAPAGVIAGMKGALILE